MGGNPFINTNRPLKKSHALHDKCKFYSFVRHAFRQCQIRNDKPFKIKKFLVLKGMLNANNVRPKINWVLKSK